MTGRWNWELTGFRYLFTFNKNGTFSYYFKIGNSAAIAIGKYYTSGEKIYITGLKSDSGTTNWANKVVEYKIGNDNIGTYLTASTLHPDDTYLKNNPNMKFRRY